MNTDTIARILNIKDEFLTNHEFRRYFRSRIRENVSELPSVPSIAMGPAIDENTIIKLNQLMSPEEKKNFLTNILHFKNIDFNVYYLILNSSEEVRTYIIEILTYAILDIPILNLNFYDIANIYLYILANTKEYTCKDVLQHLKNGMLMYDPSILDSAHDLKLVQDNLFKQNVIDDNVIDDNVIDDNVIDDKTNILDILKLKTDEQLEQHKNNFYQQVEEQEQEQENRKLKQIKILKILGISLLCQGVLIACGLPPFTRIINKTVKTLFDLDN